MLEFIWQDALRVLIISLVAVVYLFVLSRLLGKKQIAQLSFMDYVVGISIGSIAAEMATDLDQTPVWYYLVGMAVFFLFDLFLSWLERKTPFLKRLFKGSPLILIYDGQLNFKNLKKSKLDVNDVISMCRAKGYFDLTDVAYAVFETSGDLSVLPKGNQKPTVAEDFKDVKIEQVSLPCYLVVDGRVSFSGLNEIEKDKNWLLTKLKMDSDKELKKILLATYDTKTKKIDVNFKQN